MATEFHGCIAHFVDPGQIFIIGGKTIDCAARLNIELKTGKHLGADVPLSLSVRFSEDIVVRRTCQNGIWSDEEREENLHSYALNNPLIPGDDFQFSIFIGDTYFHVAINKVPYCKYRFRLPANTIRVISVTQDVQVVTQFDHRSIYPYPYPIVQLDSVDSFTNDVPKHFQPGHVIVITGIPYGSPKGRFALTFLEGTRGKEALHFNPRFHPDYIIVRNAMNDNLQFGAEERDGVFPFTLNEQFKLAIGLSERAFLFAVNGRFFGAFKYRTHDVLDHLNGFRMFGKQGMQLEITAVDHIIMGTFDCNGFENYSRPEVDIE